MGLGHNVIFPWRHFAVAAEKIRGFFLKKIDPHVLVKNSRRFCRFMKFFD